MQVSPETGRQLCTNPSLSKDEGELSSETMATEASTDDMSAKEKYIDPKAVAPPDASDQEEEAAEDADDESSSDDDSSFFRKHLPDPKSFSSNLPSAGRESDASLSFSEDSEDGQPRPDLPALDHKTRRTHMKTPEIGAQGITRMHSYSSLVSEDNLSTGSNELDVVSTQDLHRPQSNVPSGRMPGDRFAVFSPSTAPESSPPTIMPMLQHPAPYLHPQAHAAPWLDQPEKEEALPKAAAAASQHLSREIPLPQPQLPQQNGEKGFKVYPRRWLMLFYMSILNLLSDWTCYSVAPIALLTEEAFGSIDPELLVTIFLVANAIASGLEPLVLSRLGLRKTVLAGAGLLMLGSIVKSGGLPPIIGTNLEKGRDEWRVYAGFAMVGLSQPLYQCTPALLSASWFPEKERTMATGIALNANQLGIGFAFIFGTILVAKSEDIPSYFGLLSILSTITFIGTLIQFEDAPPTPPSDTARVIRGSLDVGLPNMQSMLSSFRNIRGGGDDKRHSTPAQAARAKKRSKDRRRRAAAESKAAPAPSPALFGSVSEYKRMSYPAPSPANTGPVRTSEGTEDEQSQDQVPYGMPSYPYYGAYTGYGALPGYPSDGPPQQQHPYQYGAYQHHPGWDPQYHQYAQQQYPPLPYHPYAMQPGYLMDQYSSYRYYAPYDFLPKPDSIDEGVEPVLTLRPNHLDIDIRDDQVILSIKACFARPGFLQSLVCFAISGIVINTLSTFMDHLVRLNGAGRQYTGIVGGIFQFVIMFSSLAVGTLCDKTRAYYSITLTMLVFGAFALAMCALYLDADNGNGLRIWLVVVGMLVGPLQPVSTELGVDVVYPLSENTVLVIQQLYSNLLSALFIPVFKYCRGFMAVPYMFSLYSLGMLHVLATLYFGTFNGEYLRHEHEKQRAAEKRQAGGETTAFHPIVDERTALVS